MTKVKSRTMSASKQPTPPAAERGRADRVWHVFRFRERFELADDQRFCRKGPLIYARDYVTPADDESCAYLQQIESLRRRADGLELEGAWARIRAAASRRSRAYRGFLLNERLEPASSIEIGRTVLYVPPQRAEKILGALEAVGLIERVAVPDWDLSLNDLPKKKGTAKRQKAGPGDNLSRETTRNPERARETTSATERRRAPLNAKRKEKERKEKAKPRPSASERKEKANSRPSASERKAQENSRPSASERKMQENSRPSASATAQTHTQAMSAETSEETTTSPASAPPMTPTPSDDGRASGSLAARPESVHADDLGHLSHALSSVRRRCNQAALQAGRDIYRALGSPWPDDSPESAREVGAFAGCFERAVGSGIGPAVLVELWESLVKEARRLAKLYSKNGGYRSAARVWCKKILPGKLAAAAQPRSPP